MQLYSYILFLIAASTGHVLGDLYEKDVVFEYSSLVFESPSKIERSIENVVAGIQVYNDTVYVNIPRLISNVSVTLATVEKKENGKVVFKPFPTAANQKLGDCKNFQSVGGIRIVRKTNLLYVTDNKFNVCRAKLIIIDLVRKKVIKRYEFPESVINGNKSTSFGDVVVDRKGMVYISNAEGHGSIIVYNSKTSNSLAFRDRLLENDNENIFNFGNDSFSVSHRPYEMTLSPDDDFLFIYKHNSKMIQVPTKSFRVQRNTMSMKDIRVVGIKLAKGFGILMGKKYMYMTDLKNKKIYTWNRNADLEKQKKFVIDANVLTMETVEELPKDIGIELCPGKMSFDNYGYLWLITMDYQLYFPNSTDTKEYTTKVVKLQVDDSREWRTTSTAALDRRLLMSVIIAMVILCIVL